MSNRLPLVERRRLARAAARARIAARTVRPIPPALRQFDPLARTSPGRELGDAATVVAVSAMLHGAIAAGGIMAGGDHGRDTSTEVAIEVQERKAEQKKPEPPPPPPPPVVEPERIERERPVAKEVAPPPPEPEPEPENKKAPPRVVGLSFDSTGEGGEGPAFATGNTRAGQTEKKAVDPKSVGREPPKPATTPAPTTKPPNKEASRLPVAGAKYVLPKRKRPAKLAYPEQLKSQGIEADVTVMVSIDATGKVTAVKIARGAPYPEFDEAAKRAAMTEQFAPAMKDGVAIPYSLSFTYRFRLED